jgi:hypothetical protein
MRTSLALAVLLVFFATTSCSGDEDDGGSAGSQTSSALSTTAPQGSLRTSGAVAVTSTSSATPGSTTPDTTARGDSTSSSSGSVDSDGDGVPDGSDNCPHDKNPDQRNMCSSTTKAPHGACRASVFFIRVPALSRPLVAVAFGAEPISALSDTRVECPEGNPRVDPPNGWKDIFAADGIVYVLADESAANSPAGGLHISDAEYDQTGHPRPASLSAAAITTIIKGSLDRSAASDVAHAVTSKATLPDETWRRLIGLNRSLKDLAPPAVLAPVGPTVSPTSVSATGDSGG